MTDLTKYIDMVHTSYLASKSEEELEAITDKETFGKRETHFDQVKVRLTLIGNMIEESTSILKLEHLETLWNILIARNKISHDH
jgi:hypothetical protein